MKTKFARKLISYGSILLSLCLFFSPSVTAQDRSVYFGDLHVHTRLSLDAFSFGTRTGPDEAYRFARGEMIEHASGQPLQLDRPFDFYAVTDHAEYLGILAQMNEKDHAQHKAAIQLGILDVSTVKKRAKRHPAVPDFVAKHSTKKGLRDAWTQVIDAAEKHNDPGKFTTFIGYEYTSSREGGNLHRNVIFENRSVPRDIFGRLESANPESLWHWMDKQRGSGFDVLAIPHNSNGSDGWMFESVQTDGSAIDTEYAQLRMRNEPIVEITQVKGTSETHPFLSPNDEWARFEIFPYRIASWQKSRPRGSYVRDAYRTGLELANDKNVGFNPYKFGLVGASDTHNTGSRSDEKNFMGKVGLFDASALARGSIPVTPAGELPAYRNVFRTLYGAAGITGVWADDNTREAIFAAMKRKETFATSGPRISVRFFAAKDLPSDWLSRADNESSAYKMGVPMGGDLSRLKSSPVFAVTAMRDALSAPLQRLQIIKGWIEMGDSKEKVFDIACSDGLEVDPATNRCPDNNAIVDLSDCNVSDDVGAGSLRTLWKDPEFNTDQAAFYYVRVLQNPTCRWSTWDAVRAGVTPRAGIETTLQERAWTSPIWYTP